MKLISNSGTERALDELRSWPTEGAKIDIMTSSFSVHAFDAIADQLERAGKCRMILGNADVVAHGVFGGLEETAIRARLKGRWLAGRASNWLKKTVEVRHTKVVPPQSLIVGALRSARKALLGSCSFSTEGLGITPGAEFGIVQVAETVQEAETFGAWFETHWNGLGAGSQPGGQLVELLDEAASQRPPSLLYFQVLYQLFKDLGDELDEERIIKSATGIRNAVVWNKLFRFERDGVVGAIDKLERIGGCIIADSVGLGKTFEALAVIKYYELRNDRVLVLCPKRLRDNWTLYKANDRRNILAADRFNYDVLNHTDLSRDGGSSGDIDLSHVNWVNYDLVVIDESHNFRNKATHKDRDTRYDHLMKRVIKSGVKTKVLRRIICGGHSTTKAKCWKAM